MRGYRIGSLAWPTVTDIPPSVIRNSSARATSTRYRTSSPEGAHPRQPWPVPPNPRSSRRRFHFLWTALATGSQTFRNDGEDGWVKGESDMGSGHFEVVFRIARDTVSPVDEAIGAGIN